jgi:hypothetical protein
MANAAMSICTAFQKQRLVVAAAVPVLLATEKETADVLVDYATGRVDHRWNGSCPDTVNGPNDRDLECPVCAALIARTTTEDEGRHV